MYDPTCEQPGSDPFDYIDFLKEQLASAAKRAEDAEADNAALSKAIGELTDPYCVSCGVPDGHAHQHDCKWWDWNEAQPIHGEPISGKHPGTAILAELTELRERVRELTSYAGKKRTRRVDGPAG